MRNDSFLQKREVNKDYNYGLGLLKFLCAFLVVLCHFGGGVANQL